MQRSWLKSSRAERAGSKASKSFQNSVVPVEGAIKGVHMYMHACVYIYVCIDT